MCFYLLYSLINMFLEAYILFTNLLTGVPTVIEFKMKIVSYLSDSCIKVH